MNYLFKFLLITFLFTTQAFSKQYYWYIPSFADTLVKVESTIIDSNHVRIGNDIYSMSVEETDYHLDSQKNFEKNTIYSMGEGGRKLIFKGNFIKVGCSSTYAHTTGVLKGECREGLYDHPTYGNPKRHFHPFDFIILTKVTTCQPDEHFNTFTKQCQKCSEGQKWDQQRNMCWKDCTNIDKNMYGFFDYTVSGKCYDCSHAKTTSEVYKCLCGGKGYGVPNELTDVGDINGDGCRFNGTCSNGYRFPYTDPECKKPKDPKPDDSNNTKPNQNDNNSTKPNDSGNSGNSGGGNSGNSGGDNNGQENNNNDDSGGGGPGGSEFCKKNPNHESCKENENDKFCKDNPKDPKCKLSEFCKKNPNHKSCKPGKPGGDGNTTIIDNSSSSNGNGDDEKAVFNEGDFKYGDVEKEYNEFKSKYISHLDQIMSGFDNFKDGVNQFIDNVKGNGMNPLTKKNVPKTCSHKYNIDFYGYSVEMDFDFCKVVSPASDAFYHLFYVIFFLGFLMLIIKLLIFSF